MGSQLTFDGQTVVVTGAGSGLGRAYALFFASRGANVIVNDIVAKAADTVVQDITSGHGTAIANHDSVENGERIIEAALGAFGRIDVLVNNAGIVEDVLFENMTDAQWDTMLRIHLFGAYKCSRAAWPHFRKQKYGRVINTTSDAGLFGHYPQSHYAAAKFALVALTETLAKEGLKYNIICNAIAPLAASGMTKDVFTPELIAGTSPDWVVPVAVVLAHPSNTHETGGIFQAASGHVSKLRWERSKGALLKPDENLTAGAIIRKWNDIVDFSQPTYPTGVAPFLDLLEEAQAMSSSAPEQPIDFNGKVALITGAGGGLGRVYALLFAKLGASVVVNDVVDPDPVVQEIRQAGGVAVPSKASVEDGPAVVKPAIAYFGRIDILVNNAGILRDKAFANMTEDLWHPVLNIHLRGTYSVTRAAWPYFIKQKYGRVVNTASPSGIYGNFGQANYAAAKLGILGLSRSLASGGAEHNIYVNTIAPNAGTNMTRTVMPEEIVAMLKPDHVAPFVVLLCSDIAPQPTNGLYECGSGYFAQIRLQRTGGHGFPHDKKLTPEAVLEMWDRIVTFDERADAPTTPICGLERAMENTKNLSAKSSEETDTNNQILANINQAKKTRGKASPYDWTERDVILYALSLGARHKELPLVYEGDANFQVLPTFATLPWFNSDLSYSFDDITSGFSPMKLLHAEHYFEISRTPIPKAAKTVTVSRLLDVIDKGKATVSVTGYETKDVKTGELLFYNEATVFLRDAGGFGGPREPSTKRISAAVATNTPPDRKADVIIEEKTTEDQAALYRLNGDYNPLHIDPEFSKVGGFKTPILHGLCTLGISGKHVYKTFGHFKNLKVRFTGVVLPGQTLQISMWKERSKVLFQTLVSETGKLAISGGGAGLAEGLKPRL